MKLLWLLACLVPAFAFTQINYPYKNLALEGGGVRGLAYAGALEVLEQKNILRNSFCLMYQATCSTYLRIKSDQVSERYSKYYYNF